MSVTTTATIKADIIFDQQQSFSQSTSNLVLQGSTDYTVSLSSGSGAEVREIDSIYNLGGSIISSGGTATYDLKSLEQPSFGTNYTISLTGLKGLIIRNHNTGITETLSLKATGTNAFTNLFNGGSGNVNIPAGGSYFYSDPFYGTAVTDSNKVLTLTSTGSGTGVLVSVIIAGTSGTGG